MAASKFTANRAFDKDVRVSAYLVDTAAHASRNAVAALRDASSSLHGAVVGHVAPESVEDAERIAQLAAQVNEALEEVRQIAARVIRREESK